MKRQILKYLFLALAGLTVLFVGAKISATAFYAESVLSNSEITSVAKDERLELYEKEWKLIKIEGKTPETDKAFIKFDQKNKSIGGNGSCNYIGGKFTKKANKIKFTDLSTTVMACQKGLKDESKLMENLKLVDEYKVENKKLLLFVNNRVVLEFESK